MTPAERDTLLAIRDMAEAHAEPPLQACGAAMRYIIERVDNLLDEDDLCGRYESATRHEGEVQARGGGRVSPYLIDRAAVRAAANEQLGREPWAPVLLALLADLEKADADVVRMSRAVAAARGECEARLEGYGSGNYRFLARTVIDKIDRAVAMDVSPC
jgi:hypothetical protein